MGSHYIPVGKLKIDKDILDIACPAAGYGSTPPPADIYCPANGYVLKYPEYVPPAGMIIPESGPETITFICNGSKGVFERKLFETNISSTKRWTVYDSNGNIVNSYISTNPSYTIAFPTDDYYTVVVSIDTPDAYFTVFSTTNALASSEILTESVIFNTPNITSLLGAFQYFVNLQQVIFNCTLNYLTTFENTFSYCSIESFTFKSSYPALVSVRSMFAYSQVKIIRFPSDCHLPVLTNMATFATNSAIKEMYFPDNLPEVTSLYAAFNATNLESIRMFLSAPKMQTLNGFLQSTKVSGTVTFPDMPLCTNIVNLISQASKIKRLIFEGNLNTTTGVLASGACIDAYALEEIQWPNAITLNSSTVWSDNNYNLVKVKVPNSIGGPNLGWFFLVYDNVIMREWTGNGENLDGASSIAISKSVSLFNVPKCRVSKIMVATYAPNLTAIEIDWANSTYSAKSPQILISAALSATEINRILTALPTVTDKTADFRYCDGYATCNKTIATAKGWTML